MSNGDNYDKSPIPDHDTKPKFKAPIRTWTPVIAPSCALFYDGSLFPWRGHLAEAPDLAARTGLANERVVLWYGVVPVDADDLAEVRIRGLRRIEAPTRFQNA